MDTIKDTTSPKKKMSTGKKVLIGIGIFIISIIILSELFPIDYYKDGIDYYNKQNYKKAYEYLCNVKQSDKNYNDAIVKIKEIKPIIDSLNNQAAVKKENIDATAKTNTDNQNTGNGMQGTIGQSYSLGSLTYKIEKVKFKKYIGGVYTLNKADGVFLIITLTVTNKAKEQVAIDNSFFRLIDDTGAVYDYSPDGTATLELSEFPGETFMGMIINPNITKKAKVVFEVPSKKKNYKLIFEDPFSDKSLEINMNE